jgi:hypothetical protein
MTVRLTQTRLDYQDGVLLHLMGNLIRIFDAANEMDRRIPRLFPSSTYLLFGRKRASDRTEATEPPDDVAGAPESDANGAGDAGTESSPVSSPESSAAS